MTTSPEQTDRIEAYLAARTPAVRPIVERLRALVRSTLPDMVETVDGHDVLRYGRGASMGQMICYLSAHRAHANLGFARGAGLPDPDGRLEGTGKNMRHVKVRSVAEAEHPSLRRLLETAAAPAEEIRRPGPSSA